MDKPPPRISPISMVHTLASKKHARTLSIPHSVSQSCVILSLFLTLSPSASAFKPYSAAFAPTGQLPAYYISCTYKWYGREDWQSLAKTCFITSPGQTRHQGIQACRRCRQCPRCWSASRWRSKSENGNNMG
jgi:hypothetical protein